MASKIEDAAGAPIATAHGIRIYVQLQKPKTSRGKTRLWINLRQTGENKRWRQSECLAYINAVDVQFEER